MSADGASCDAGGCNGERVCIQAWHEHAKRTAHCTLGAVKGWRNQQKMG